MNEWTTEYNNFWLCSNFRTSTAIGTIHNAIEYLPKTETFHIFLCFCCFLFIFSSFVVTTTTCSFSELFSFSFWIRCVLFYGVCYRYCVQQCILRAEIGDTIASGVTFNRYPPIKLFWLQQLPLTNCSKSYNNNKKKLQVPI